MAFVHNIKCIVQYYPLYRYPLFKKMGFGEADVPISDALFDNMVSFPFHHWMSGEDFTHLVFSALATLDELRGEPHAIRC
jgi:dTDP-4-amino-4,6-dideoxygalactose transaminase